MTDILGVNLDELLLKAVKVFNKYRSPEATAEFVEMENDGFVIEFEGSLCSSCGVFDYFEDFIHELEQISSVFSVELKDYKPTGSQSFKARYKIKNNSSNEREDVLFQEFLLDSGLSFNEYLESNACTKEVIRFHFRNWLFERNKTVT
jgi:hypothetical protein